MERCGRDDEIYILQSFPGYLYTLLLKDHCIGHMVTKLYMNFKNGTVLSYYSIELLSEQPDLTAKNLF